MFKSDRERVAAFFEFLHASAEFRFLSLDREVFFLADSGSLYFLEAVLSEVLDRVREAINRRVKG